MISISTFKAHKELPELAIQNNIKMELNKLVEPVFYDDDLINSIKTSPYFDYYISAHGPFLDLIPPSNDREIKELCFLKFKRTIEACEKLCIKNIVFHTGWQKDFYLQKIWIDNSIIFWNSIMQICSKDINIHIENIFENKIELIKEIVCGVDKNNFKVCLDIGHLNLIDPENISSWIVELRDYIGHLHIHNNNGKEDNHNGLDNGIIDMRKILKIIAENCYNANWNLEIRNNFQNSIDIIKEYKKNG